MNVKTATIPVPNVNVGAATEALSEALEKVMRVETGLMVGGVFAVPVAEKAAYTSFRGIFGNSGEGLSERERIARQLYRFGLALVGGYLAAQKKPEMKALGTGIMAEATVNLLKGFGLSIV